MELHLYASQSIRIFIFILILACSECNNVPTNNDKARTNILLDILNIAEKGIHTAKNYAVTGMRPDGKILHSTPMDCAEIFEQNRGIGTGIYTIWPRNRISKTSISVYCDMEDDGGGWTVIQRRGDFGNAKDYFYRDWVSYKEGFGDFSHEFWIGNDNIFALTNERSNLVKFSLSDWEGNNTYAMYNEFWIDDEFHNYTVHVANYSGTAGDSFSATNGYAFTTKDRDNDANAKNCAVLFKGAWWYWSCHGSNPNGQNLKGAHESYADGIDWSSFRGSRYSLKDTWIKIRPKNFLKNINTNITPQ